MNDQGSEILRTALGEEKAPLTEKQVETAKKSAIFAVISFNPDFASGDWFKKINPGLTQDQIDFAKRLHEVFPKPRDVLPKTEFNSALQGFSRLVATPMYEIIPSLVENKDEKFGGSENEELVARFRQDPTGVSSIRYLLQEMEEKATISQIELHGKEDEVKTKIAAILTVAKKIPDTQPEPKPENPSEDEAVANMLFNALVKAFGGPQNPRDAFVSTKRAELFGKLPMEFGEDHKILPADTLRVLGARLAFEHYQTAVNVYLNRWGNQTKN